VRHFLLGFMFCLVVFMGCAGFSIRYYGLSQVNYNDGVLLGPKAKDDLPFSKCAPIGNEPQPCIVMFTQDFFMLKQDYLDTKQKLKECQKK
jgi:hypothetical protein